MAVDATAPRTVTEAVHEVAAGHLSLVDAGHVAPLSTFVATVQTTTTTIITLTMQPKLLSRALAMKLLESATMILTRSQCLDSSM